MRSSRRRADTPRVLDEAFLADVPDQRRVTAPNEAIAADPLALRGNLKVAGALIASCSGLRIELEGLLEIVGFWTADYVAKKLRRWRAAGLGRLILSIDAARNCGGEGHG